LLEGVVWKEGHGHNGMRQQSPRSNTNNGATSPRGSNGVAPGRGLQSSMEIPRTSLIAPRQVGGLFSFFLSVSPEP
jgi:hypothetical protein